MEVPSAAFFVVFLSFVNCNAARIQQLPQYDAGLCLGTPACDSRSFYRTYDGSCSSLGHPSWGRAGRPYIRTGPPTYDVDLTSLRLAKDGNPLPNARKISSTLLQDQFIPDDIHTLSLMAWGQLVNHDVNQKRLSSFIRINIPCCTTDFQMLSKESLPQDCIPVEISRDDYFYSKHNVRCISVYRATALQGGYCKKYPREQVNNISQVIDGSGLYGSDEKTAFLMRSFVGGKLKVDLSGEGHSFLTNDSDPLFPCLNPPSEHKCYFSGSQRVNQNPGVLVLTTALLRLHNYLCDQMVITNPHWSDETIYQEVRRIIGAFLQHVTFKHYLPTLLGREFVKRKGLLKEGLCNNYHDVNIIPESYTEFAGAAYRSFHSLVAREFTFVDKHFKEKGFIHLDDFYLRPTFIEYHGAFDGLVRGLADKPCQKMDQHYSVGVTNYLFKANRSFGGDLEILDIMAGRDMGLPPYINMRLLCDHKQINDFDDLRDVMTEESIWKLRNTYTQVEDIDLLVGGVMEELIPGTMVGPTFQCIIGEQFYHYMRGDRFYYENCGFPWSFTTEQINAIRKMTLAWMFCVTGDDVDHITMDTFHKPSLYNPIVSCDDIPHLDISLWTDHAGR